MISAVITEKFTSPSRTYRRDNNPLRYIPACVYANVLLPNYFVAAAKDLSLVNCSRRLTTRKKKDGEIKLNIFFSYKPNIACLWKVACGLLEKT